MFAVMNGSLLYIFNKFYKSVFRWGYTAPAYGKIRSLSKQPALIYEGFFCVWLATKVGVQMVRVRRMMDRITSG